MTPEYAKRLIAKIEGLGIEKTNSIMEAYTKLDIMGPYLLGYLDGIARVTRLGKKPTKK